MFPVEWAFYLVAIPAVVISGLGKGGMGSALGMISVPLMAFVIPPTEAAAIMLPLLIVMDALAIWSYRHHIDWLLMKLILPAGLLGVVLGALLFDLLSEQYIRLLIGCISVAFSLHQWLGSRWLKHYQPGKTAGWILSLVAGFTSYGIHAGGPPLSVYMLPLRMNKQLLAGTMGVFFGIINVSKLFAYGHVGQMNVSTLMASLVLLPLCPISVLAGKAMVKRLNEAVFYQILFIGLFITGIKLIYDGVTPLFS